MLINTICPACGNQFSVQPYRIRNLEATVSKVICCSPSCAYVMRESPPSQTHGYTRGGRYSKEYRAWCGMRRRCNDKRNKRYDRYGGRGITVCKRWMSFENFLADVGYAPSKDHSLGRIDNDGNYEPGNVEWQLPTVQANNKCNNWVLSAFGKTQPLNDWAKERKIRRLTLRWRLVNGWSVEDALLKPTDASKRNRYAKWQPPLR